MIAKRLIIIDPFEATERTIMEHTVTSIEASQPINYTNIWHPMDADETWAIDLGPDNRLTLPSSLGLPEVIQRVSAVAKALA